MQVDTILERMLFTGPVTAPRGGDGGVVMVLVTNKHVVKRQAQAVTALSAPDESGVSPKLGPEILVGVGPASLVRHPDPHIDVAILPIGGLIDQLRAARRTPFFMVVDAASAATTEVIAGYEPIEPVMFIG